MKKDFHTSISIEERHKKWIEQKAINFSKWVRKKIDEEIEKEKRGY